MRWSRMITVVGAHAEGEVGRVITGGVVDVPGKTMLDKMRHLNGTDDRLRRFALFEPRGSAQMSANLLLPPAPRGRRCRLPGACRRTAATRCPARTRCA